MSVRAGSVAVGLAIAASFACTGGGTETDVGSPEVVPAPTAPAPTPPSPQEGKRGKRGPRGGRTAKSPDPNAVELAGDPYGQAWTQACTSCGRSPCDKVTVKATTSSGEAKRVLDGVSGTAWCGTGPLAFELPDGCSVYAFSILAGDFKSPEALKQSGRAAEIAVDVDGTPYVGYLDDPADLAIARDLEYPAHFEVEGHPTAKKLTIEVLDVYGSGAPCVSELKLFQFPKLDQ